MGTLKKTALTLTLASLIPLYANHLADNNEIQANLKWASYSPNELSLSPVKDSLTSEESVELKKKQKLPVRRSVSSYPRLVVVTTPISVSSPNDMEIESSQTNDNGEEGENQPDMINVYAQEILAKQIELRPVTLVNYEKW